MKSKSPIPLIPPSSVEICILAGGLSSRMGLEKTRLRLGGRTLLARIKSIAAETAWPVRVVRRDVVPRCGPLGGVCTALRTTKAEAVLFLACDMPLITVELLTQLAEVCQAEARAVFTLGGRAAGFPFLLRREDLAQVEGQFAAGRFSLQGLAARCRARMVRAPEAARTLTNVNTPEDWRRLRQEEGKRAKAKT